MIANWKTDTDKNLLKIVIEKNTNLQAQVGAIRIDIPFVDDNILLSSMRTPGKFFNLDHDCSISTADCVDISFSTVPAYIVNDEFKYGLISSQQGCNGKVKLIYDDIKKSIDVAEYDNGNCVFADQSSDISGSITALSASGIPKLVFE